MPSCKPANSKASTTPIPSAVKPGRPLYVPNDKDRVMVRLLCAAGVAQDRIATALGINCRTLAKHFRREILVGATEIDAVAVGSLITAMRRGGKEGVAAAKWWTQSRMGWSEKLIVDEGRADVPMRVVVELVGDPAPVEIRAGAAARTTTRPGFNTAKLVQLVG